MAQMALSATLESEDGMRHRERLTARFREGMKMEIKFTREWAMPSKHTFEINPIGRVIRRFCTPSAISVDPFCGRSAFATMRNDLSTGKDAREWLRTLIDNNGEGWADVALLDPPYSPRQISESYKGVGLKASTTDTQNAKLYSESIELLDRILRPGGVAIRCGWNSAGFGKGRGYRLTELLLVAHGGAHNDTIVTVEIKSGEQSNLFT